MSNPIIQVENLTKEYVIGRRKNNDLGSYLSSLFSKNSNNKNKIKALDNVSFSVEEGEILGIVGPNGSGKSTLLKILSKITNPSSGKVFLRGNVASLLEIGTGFHPELTGRENIYLNGSLLGMQRNEIKRRFDEIVDFSGISKFIDTPVKHYSSGMYVRLGFSIASHLDPEILLVDEVLAVGDISFRKKSTEKLSEVSQKGKTILFVSHNLALLKKICTQGVYFNNGIIKYADQINNVVNKYINDSQVSAGLEGKSNFIFDLTTKITNNSGNYGRAILSGENTTISSSFFSFDKYEEVLMKFEIFDTENNRIIVLSNHLTGEVIHLDKGENIINCIIPKLPLNTGLYSITLELIDQEVVLFKGKVLDFEVFQGNFYLTGRLPYTFNKVLVDHFFEIK